MTYLHRTLTSKPTPAFGWLRLTYWRWYAVKWQVTPFRSSMERDSLWSSNDSCPGLKQISMLYKTLWFQKCNCLRTFRLTCISVRFCLVWVTIKLSLFSSDGFACSEMFLTRSFDHSLSLQHSVGARRLSSSWLNCERFRDPRDLVGKNKHWHFVVSQNTVVNTAEALTSWVRWETFSSSVSLRASQ